MPSGKKPKPPTILPVEKCLPATLQDKPVAIEKWESLMLQLGSRSLTPLSRDHATRYCELYQLYSLALTEATKTGLTTTAKNGYPCSTPAFNILCQLSDRMRRLALDLGLKEEAMACSVESASKWRGLVAE